MCSCRSDIDQGAVGDDLALNADLHLCMLRSGDALPNRFPLGVAVAFR